MGGLLATDSEDLPAERNAKPWARVGTTHFTNWTKTASILWNFDPNINYSFFREPRLQPWCLGNRHFTVEILETNNGLYGTNLEVTQRRQRSSNSTQHKVHLPLTLHTAPPPFKDLRASGLKPLQVVGSRGDLAVLQVVRPGEFMQFLVVNLRTGDYVGRHVEPLRGDPYLCEVILSPDCKKFILKPNSIFLSDFMGETADTVPCEMKLVSIEDGQCVVDRVFMEEGCVHYVVSFDPRYGHSRAAVGNYDGGKTVCIFDLQQNELAAESDPRQPAQTSRNLVFSPNGQYLASLVFTASYQAGLHSFPKVNIYETEHLFLLQRISCAKMFCVALIPAVLFPLFSECGTRLAVAYGRNIDIMGSVFGQELAFVEIYRVPVKHSLQSLCRVAVRRAVSRENVLQLPIPRRIKDYLLYRPRYQ
ncbi:hypothetical protein CAPTEDRAFT_213666 [Capitella teleta]|uniref:SOCS box domain-containing protein n=1 Tax=Capitella teleta TaxID=283909 RepID=R7VJB5_CAPTE|nr:hypothetical protein CAPTEDRAFT_213666 [Capitella teleta]|eukprot:ELU16441.1 hypothetical protein CAPTEDRAFT_213666 [Capitella teleta]